MQRRNYLQSLSALAGLAGVSAVTAQEEYPAYDSSATYTGGDRVVYEGYVWEAQWWTKGTAPSADEAVWEKVGPADGDDGSDGGSDDGSDGGSSDVPAYDSSTAYSGGDQVTYDGFVWEAEWWTKGTEPAESANVWTKVRAVDDGDNGGDDGDDGGTTELVADLSVSTQFPDADTSVEFDASGSTSPNSIESYEWDFGDGSSATGQTVTHTFARGQYDVTLTITDADGNTATDSIQITAGRPQLDQQRVVAYWRQWAQYDRGYTPDMIPYDNVTHVQYAFLRPEKDGSLEFLHANGGQDLYGSRFMHNGDAGTFYDGEIEDWRSVGDKAFSAQAKKRDDTKFVASVGGWGDSEYFSPVAQDPAKREKFAQDCVELVESYNLDGIDIDWEYPGGGGCTSESPVCDIDNISQEGDQKKFTLLMQEIRDALDKAAEEDPDRSEPYELTAAVVADPEKAKGLEHEKLSDLCDFVSVMTFDYRGIWSGHTAHHSPLKQNPDNPEPKADTWNASSALSWWEDQGWDPEQLNMAVPFYGRSWSGVQAPDGSGNGKDDGLFQPFKGEGKDASGDGSYPSAGDGGTNLGGIWEYFDLGGDGRQGSNSLNLDSSDWETYFDEEAVASWSYNKSKGLMISHPTEQSIEAKMNWLSQSNYGGTMLWSIGGDTKDGELISTLWNSLNE